MLLGLLPVVVLFALIILLANIMPDSSWRRACLRAGVLWASYIAVLNELLSIWRAITLIGLIIAWSLPLVGVVVFFFVHLKRGHNIRLPHLGVPNSLSQSFMIVGIVIILCLTAILAWHSPPQTWDTLNYHMPKVAHWAQDQAVHHFTTGIEPQNYMSPGLEYIVLHFYILSGGDRFVTMVNWLMVLGCLCGVSLIVSQFGLGLNAQTFAALFAATLPTGIVQASSTMTDTAVAFWMVIVAVETIALAKEEKNRFTIFFLSLSAGLAILSKPTAYAFALPIAVFVIITLIRQKDPKRFARSISLAFMLVLLLNLGHLSRNQARYGNPFGPKGRISTLIPDGINLSIILSNTLRNASLHAGTPSPYVNKGIYLFVEKVHEIIGIDIMDSRTTHSQRYKVFPPSTHEDLTSNPLHALLILIAFFLLLWRRNRVPREVVAYGLCVALSFVLVSSMVQWQLYNARLHQAFFYLAVPWTVFMLNEVMSQRSLFILGVLLLFASWPWLVHIRSRPIFDQPGESYVDNVINESRIDLYYASGGHLKVPHSEIAARIQESRCSRIGLVLMGNEAEYPLWMLLGAPRNAPRIEWIIEDKSADTTDKSDFQPCAVILHPCAQDQGMFDGLPRVYEHKQTRYCLYLESVEE